VLNARSASAWTAFCPSVARLERVEQALQVVQDQRAAVRDLAAALLRPGLLDHVVCVAGELRLELALQGLRVSAQVAIEGRDLRRLVRRDARRGRRVAPARDGDQADGDRIDPEDRREDPPDDAVVDQRVQSAPPAPPPGRRQAEQRGADEQGECRQADEPQREVVQARHREQSPSRSGAVSPGSLVRTILSRGPSLGGPLRASIAISIDFAQCRPDIERMTVNIRPT